MNGNRYVESTARQEICALLKQCGPLTATQVNKLRKKYRSEVCLGWLLKNGYVGMLPTYPMKFVPGAREYVAGPMAGGMQAVIGALEKLGQATSEQISEAIGKPREHVDAYLRAARVANRAHRCGEVKTYLNMTAYLWTIGPGENYVRNSKRQQKLRARAAKAKPAEVVKSPVNVHRDPLVAAFFGQAAA